MSVILLLRIFWSRLAMALSPISIRMDGLWDRGRLQTDCSEEVTAWKNVLLLHPRREALNNGAVVTKVEHLKNKEEHEFLRFHVLHEGSKEGAVFLLDRDIYPKDLEGPPKPYEEIFSPGTEKYKKRGCKAHIALPESESSEQPASLNHAPDKKDVPEERDMNLKITHLSGEIVYCSSSIIPSHKVLDRVHRGVGDLEKWMSPHGNILELQTLTFPECASPPPLLKVAFYLSALSEFAPRHHVGEYQSYWFARAACDGLHAAFQGSRLKPGREFRAMGKWQAAAFKYINPTASVVAEYNQQLQQFEDAFKAIQAEGRQLGGVQEGHQLGIKLGQQEGIEERRRLEVEIEQRMVERRRLEEEIAKLHADLAER